MVLQGAFSDSTLVIFHRLDVSLSRCIWRAACPPSDHPANEGKRNICGVNDGCLNVVHIWSKKI